MKDYELLEHTADIRIRVQGNSLVELFSRTALAVFDILAEPKTATGNAGAKPVKASFAKARPARVLVISLGADSLDELFVNWLNELLSLAYAKELIVVQADIIALTHHAIKAQVAAQPMKYYRLNTEIKAATYHQLSLKKIPAGWQAQVILDV